MISAFAHLLAPKTRALLLPFIAILAFVLSAPAQPSTPDLHIITLSSRPDMISGGDVLLQIAVPEKIALDKIVVTLNGVPVNAAFLRNASAHSLTGLLSGLKIGENMLEVRNGKKLVAHQALKNFPNTGPILAGPQEHPFLCQTNQFLLPNGDSLGDPIDANCSAHTVVQYVYKSTEPLPKGVRAGAINIKPLPNLRSLPDDVAMTTTTAGKTVPYVVRVETGTINRAIYQFAVLSDPVTEHNLSPLSPPKNWNGKLVYGFGGGCVSGWHRQGFTLGADNGSRGQGSGEILRPDSGSAVINDAVVGRGYAEAGSSLNVSGNNCNDVLSAETMMMVKERFIKAYGKPLFTIGRGASGGSYQQYQIADRYPGLLDGLIPSMTFPDVQELIQILVDSRLLDNYFDHEGSKLTAEQKLAISGVAELDNLTASDPLAGRINPTEYCPLALPKNEKWDAKLNPAGVRCDVYDHSINIYGKDPVTGYARRPVDNVGVQYGLAALNEGKITPAEFIELNEKIGGFDSNGFLSPHRAVADTLGLLSAYQNDLITYGSHLDDVPIIDVRPYRDKMLLGDYHLKYHSFALRARLRAANGTAANDIMIVGPQLLLKQMESYAIDQMDRWLTALIADKSEEPLAKKILRNKPEELADACWTATGERITEPQTYSGGRCNQLYPTAPSPRMVAGESLLGNSILKCQLKPIEPSDYRVTLTEEELARLRSIFPQGVCDYFKPGVEQQPPNITTWHVY